MADTTSPRKRKRPSYLTESFLESDSEDDSAPTSKKKAVCKEEYIGCCFLCAKPIKGSGNSTITDNIGSSEHTFSEVLTKLFNKEQLPKSLIDRDFSKGLLCTSCTDLIGDLFRLQHELRGVKNDIVNTFKKSQNPDKKKKLDAVSETSDTTAKDTPNKKKEAKENVKKEKEKSVKKQPVEKKSKGQKEDVYIIESLKEKNGNKFLVKWENYSDAESTWEPKSSIPDYIVQFYMEDLARLGQPAPSAVPEEDETEEVFEVEKIVDKRVKGKKIEYLVKWKNYDEPEDDTWEPVGTLGEAAEFIEQFENELKANEEKKKEKVKPINETIVEHVTPVEVKKVEKAEPKKEKSKRSSTDGKESKPVKKSKPAPVEEDVYNVEALMEKKGSKYLVKWENYPSDQNTWEPKSSISEFIVKYYEADLTRLGTPAPSEMQQVNGVEEVEEDEFVVEKILEKRIGRKGKTEYLIKWMNYNEEDNTWEPASNIEGYKHIVEAFEKELKDIAKSVEEAVKLDEKLNKRNKTKDVAEIKAPVEVKPVIAEPPKKRKEPKPTKKEKKPTPPPDVYNIESLIKKNGSKYLVKWENYPEDQNTWEPKSSIPENIIKFYEEDSSRLGTPAPTEILQVDEDEEEEDYEVERILEKRISKKGKIEYLVKWKNFDDPADNSWEPSNNLGAVQDLVDKFEKDLEEF